MRKRIATWLVICMLVALLGPQASVEMTLAAGVEEVIIIDYGDSGYEEIGSGWNTSSRVLGYNNSDTRYTSSQNVAASAMWRPELSKSGKYKVSIFIPVHPASDPATVVQVMYGSDSYTTSIDYSTGASRWYELGEFLLVAEEDNYVRLLPSNTVGTSIRADAVKFEWTGDEETAPIDQSFRWIDSFADGTPGSWQLPSSKWIVGESDNGIKVLKQEDIPIRATEIATIGNNSWV